MHEATSGGHPEYPEFDRRFFESLADFSIIGSGEVGGKALGLARIKRMLDATWLPEAHPDFDVRIPRMAVIATDVFDRFVSENALWDVVREPPSDERIAHAFQNASLPATIVGDLRGLIDRVHQPLAIRSSSLLEDQLARPFAGVYATKMIPNNELDSESRFRRLTEAIKFVYASTFFTDARDYLSATGGAAGEKMAVVIQEVVGRRHSDRFYPDISGVARSWNFYAAGRARPEEGVVSLALGLGKTIVDGGVVWSYSPAQPRANPPVATTRELLKQTQTRFWAVNMGNPPVYDPVAETEYLVAGGLPEADGDDALRLLASTYDAASDRLTPGTGASGARVLTFAPLLVQEALPFNDAICSLLAHAEQALGAAVEIEFAVTIEPGSTPPVRIGFLQARPLLVAAEAVSVPVESLDDSGVVVASDSVLGNGVVADLADVVYLRPGSANLEHSRVIAKEVEVINHDLVAAGRPYVLIGYGRWGSSDPWLGLPVRWSQISGARVIVEASLPHAQADPSQGSHFFHNLSSIGICYFTVRHSGTHPIDWAWLDAQPAALETEYVRHVRLTAPLRVEVDGRSGRGVIRRSGGEAHGGIRT